MNIDHALLNDNLYLIDSPDKLRKFISIRRERVETILDGLTGALEELREANDSLNSPQTLKGWANWLGRKINLVEDDLPKIINDGTKIKGKISSLITDHVIHLRIFSENYSYIWLTSFPFEIKTIIICYLDQIYVKKMGEFCVKFDALTKRIDQMIV